MSLVELLMRFRIALVGGLVGLGAATVAPVDAMAA
jgi:hypothetical protein